MEASAPPLPIFHQHTSDSQRFGFHVPQAVASSQLPPIVVTGGGPNDVDVPHNPSTQVSRHIDSWKSN